MTWDEVFKKYGRIHEKPIQEMKEVMSLLKKEKAQNVLDLGCGEGRHTALLARNGFDVYAGDASPSALRLVKELLDSLGLSAKLKKFSCYKKFPFRDGFFDAVVSTQVIHHNYRKNIKKCISEMERVLKHGGLLFVTVASPKKNYRKEDRKKYRKIAPHTYMPKEGREKGIVHFLYTKNMLKEDFRDFMPRIWMSKDTHYCVLGKLKSVKKISDSGLPCRSSHLSYQRSTRKPISKGAFSP